MLIAVVVVAFVAEGVVVVVTSVASIASVISVASIAGVASVAPVASMLLYSFCCCYLSSDPTPWQTGTEPSPPISTAVQCLVARYAIVLGSLCTPYSPRETTRSPKLPGLACQTAPLFLFLTLQKDTLANTFNHSSC